MHYTKKQFEEAKQVQDAVIRRIEIIGEAVKRLPKSMTSQYPEIPWSAISGMRDKLIHDYFVVDISMVWTTAKDDLKPLKKAVKALLK